MPKLAVISEGKAKILFHPGEPTKQLEVFYNPAMKLNRDIAALLLNSVQNKDMQIADPLAATGVRAIRLLLELSKGKIKNISLNDNSKKAIDLAKKNFKLNGISLGKGSKADFSVQDANLFLLNSAGFDYIDLDPFGSPNPFLDAAVKRLSRNGILAVTATDVSSLAGTYPEVCMRKYWAVPLRNELMHEVGMRILIRKVQLIASQYEKALVPIFCHSTQHYLRAYFVCEKAKEAADEVLAKQGELQDYQGNIAGPMWLGRLWDTTLVGKMLENAKKTEKSKSGKGNASKGNKELMTLLLVIEKESKINAVGFYDIDKLCSGLKCQVPRRDLLIAKLNSLGFGAASTHFLASGLRTDAPAEKLKKIIKSL
jgi:tRNA (guanine26-N2/guanine27-N2)-dimethyltransferase